MALKLETERRRPCCVVQVSVTCAACEVRGTAVLDLLHPSDVPHCVAERALSDEDAGLTQEAVASAQELQVDCRRMHCSPKPCDKCAVGARRPPYAVGSGLRADSRLFCSWLLRA